MVLIPIIKSFFSRIIVSQNFVDRKNQEDLTAKGGKENKAKWRIEIYHDNQCHKYQCRNNNIKYPVKFHIYNIRNIGFLAR